VARPGGEALLLEEEVRFDVLALAGRWPDVRIAGTETEEEVT
jgi:hypothetical protein